MLGDRPIHAILLCLWSSRSQLFQRRILWLLQTLSKKRRSQIIFQVGLLKLGRILEKFFPKLRQHWPSHEHIVHNVKYSFVGWCHVSVYKAQWTGLCSRHHNVIRFSRHFLRLGNNLGQLFSNEPLCWSYYHKIQSAEGIGGERLFVDGWAITVGTRSPNDPSYSTKD